MKKEKILSKINELGFNIFSNERMIYIIDENNNKVASIDNTNKVFSNQFKSFNELEEKRKNKLLNYLLSYLGGD